MDGGQSEGIRARGQQWRREGYLDALEEAEDAKGAEHLQLRERAEGYLQAEVANSGARGDGETTVSGHGWHLM